MPKWIGSVKERLASLRGDSDEELFAVITDRRILAGDSDQLLGRGAIRFDIPREQIAYVRRPYRHGDEAPTLVDVTTTDVDLNWTFAESVDSDMIQKLVVDLETKSDPEAIEDAGDVEMSNDTDGSNESAGPDASGATD